MQVNAEICKAMNGFKQILPRLGGEHTSATTAVSRNQFQIRSEADKQLANRIRCWPGNPAASGLETPQGESHAVGQGAVTA
jgi:hypothetical protein